MDTDKCLDWYERLREAYRPEPVRLLLIGESPPDPGASERRFFYAPTLKIDNLYRGVAAALYGREPDFELRDKSAVLDRLRRDGVWLIDAVEHPVNRATSAQRRGAIRDAVTTLRQRCLEIAPVHGVLICHAVVYQIAAEPLRVAGVNILHDESLPFPLGNMRARFVEESRAALDRSGFRTIPTRPE